MYIHGCAEKVFMAGKCVLGIKELPNQCFLKIVEGNNFGVVKIYVCIFLFYEPSPLWSCQCSTDKNLGRFYMMSYDCDIREICLGGDCNQFHPGFSGKGVPLD